jgi:hypothetical protein
VITLRLMRTVPRVTRPSHAAIRGMFAAAALTALFAVAAAAATPAQPLSPALDEGVYVISVAGNRLGSENFAFRVLGDSLCLASQSRMRIEVTEGKRDSVDKRVFMAVGKDDLLLHTYQSNERFRGNELVRAVVITPNDTVFSVYREYDGRGQGDRRVLPPGRMYIMDSRLFSLIDFITLSVHQQSFDRRPVSLFTLGAEDTLVEAMLARVGRDTLRAGGRATPVTRMRLSQGPVVFELWVDAKGRMLRLEHPPTGLAVERQTTSVKRRASAAASKPAAKPASK